MKFDASIITQLQDKKTAEWHNVDIIIDNNDLLGMVLNNHAFNFQLWHEEDKARREDCGFEYIYQAKRAIDGFNQQRNNMIEAIDDYLVSHYQPAVENVSFNSETPGMMIDRLSILSLKLFHMAEQLQRDDVELPHLLQCKSKVVVIKLQQQHLQNALQELMQDVIAGHRSFRVYKQFKMYNDPSLNPQLYRKQSAKV